MKRENTLNPTLSPATDLLDPTEIIETMIELRIQLREIEEQIQALQPAFFTACLALNTDRITLVGQTSPAVSHPLSGLSLLMF